MAFCPLAYAWADNNQQLDPCEVASSLRDVCDSSLPPLQPINPGDTYPGPAADHQSLCVCSSVTYVLVSACSDCQGGQVKSWPTWSANCVSPSVDSFEVPLPANISIPDWANKFDVKSNSTYSPSVASSIAVALQATPTSSIAATVAAQMSSMSTNTFQTTPTDTSTPTGSSLTTTTASFGSDLSLATTENTENRTAIIAGGTIGAVVFLAMGAALVYWYMQRRRRTRVPPSVAYMAVHGLEPSDY